MKAYTITVNGNVYQVTVEEGTAPAAAAPAPAPAAAAPAPAPAPGRPHLHRQHLLHRPAEQLSKLLFRARSSALKKISATLSQQEIPC